LNQVAEKQKFTIKDILIVFVLAGLLAVGLQFALSYIPYFANMEIEDISGINFTILYLLQTIVLALPVGIVVLIRKNIRLNDFGFENFNIKSILKFAFLGYAYYLVIMMIISLASAYMKLKVPGFEAQESHIPLIGDNSIGSILTIAIITLFAPIIEEVIFRGFIFKTMMAKWHKWLAFVMSALVFATIHMEFQSILPLFILGLILNWMFFRTKSIYPGIFFHIVNNGIALGAEYYLFLHPEIMKEVQGFIHFIF